MSLFVIGSDFFRGVALRALQCLDLRVELLHEGRVNLDTTVEGHPSRVKTRQLLNALIQSGYRVQIEQSDGASECVPTYRTAGRTGSTVRWNPAQQLAHAPACSCIYLGHELCHSLQLILGLIHPSEFYGGRAAKMRYEMLTITGRYGPDTAGPGAITENDLRSEHLPRQAPRQTL